MEKDLGEKKAQEEHASGKKPLPEPAKEEFAAEEKTVEDLGHNIRIVEDTQEDEDDDIDFSKITGFFKKKKKEETTAAKKEAPAEEKTAEQVSKEKFAAEEKKAEDTGSAADDDTIDLGKITGFFKKKKKEETTAAKKEDTKAVKDAKEPATEEKTAESVKKDAFTAKEKGTSEVDSAADDDTIDLGKITGFFKKKKKEEKKQSDEDESIDLTRAVNALKGIFGRGSSEKDDDEVSINVKGAYDFARKHSAVLLIVLAILASVGAGSYLRLLPTTMPYTDNWAGQSVNNLISSDIQNAIAQQYPNLPQANRDRLVGEQMANAQKSGAYTFQTGQYTGQTVNLQQQLEQTSQHFKGFFRDPEGRMYMPDIDPYYWQRYTQNLLEKGHIGDEVRNGLQWDNHQLAPVGRAIAKQDEFHPRYLAYQYKVLKTIIPGGVTLRQSLMWYPIIVSAAIIVMIFFIGRLMAGVIGGFFAAMMAAMNSAFLNRTLFGHADSDAWVVFFSVLIVWLFLEAMYAATTRKQALFAALAGFSLGMYSIAWGGWWYIYMFVLGAAGATIIYSALAHFREFRKGLNAIVKIPTLRRTVVVTVVFVAVGGIFVSLFSDFHTFLLAPLAFLGVTTFKSPVFSNLWPNVLTTVAELNEGSVASIVGSVGGKFLFWIALTGTGLTILGIKHRLKQEDIYFAGGAAVWWVVLLGMIFPQNPATFVALMAAPVAIWLAWMLFKQHQQLNIISVALLLIWIGGTIYASTKGIRFTLLLVPAFSLGFGVALGVMHRHISAWLTREIKTPALATSVILFFVLGALLFTPTNAFAQSKAIASQDVPLISDAWWNSLTAIKENSSENAIITSWWDFGHHFKEIADRPVTFDGTTQQLPQAHWVGKLFMESNETLAVGILRMLDCGANAAFEQVDSFYGDTVKSVNLLYRILPADREDAAAILRRENLPEQNITAILKLTHCEPPEAYVIASEDMIGKSGVWAHFGSWNFERADILFNTRNKKMDAAIQYMKNRYDYSDERARQTFFEVQGLRTDRSQNDWVAPWPSYASSLNGCSTSGEIVQCGDGLTANLSSGEAWFPAAQGNLHPSRFVYATAEGITEKVYANQTIPQGLASILIPQGKNSYNSMLSSPELANSMFTTMFFMRGQSLKHFDLLTHQTSVTGLDIYVWKVNWNGKEQPIIVPELQPKEVASIGDTVSVSYIGYLDDNSIFDSSIAEWRTKSITPNTSLGTQQSSPITFQLGSGQLITGFDEAVRGMKRGEEKRFSILPEQAYGTDPAAHPLGNQTLHFSIRLESIE